MNWNLKEAIRQAILANATITAIVGNNVSNQYAPQATPATGTWIVFTKIAGHEEGAMDGDAQLTHTTFQFTVGGQDVAKVDTVVSALVDFNCTTFTYTENATPHTLIFLHKDARDGWEEHARVYKASVDLEIWANK